MRLVAVRHMRPRPATTPSGPPQGARMGVTAGAPPGLWDPPDPGPPAGGPRGARGPGGVHFRGYLITLPVGTDVALFRYRSGIPPKKFRKFSPPRPGAPPAPGPPRGPPGTPPGPPREGPKNGPFSTPRQGGQKIPPKSTPRTGGSEGILTLDRDTASPEGVVYTALDALRGCSRSVTVHSALPIDDWSRVTPHATHHAYALALHVDVVDRRCVASQRMRSIA